MLHKSSHYDVEEVIKIEYLNNLRDYSIEMKKKKTA